MLSFYLFSFIGSVLFLLSFVIVQINRGDLAILHDALSKYAIGRGGWILTFGFYAMAIAEILLSLAFITKNGISVGNILLGLSGIGILIVAAYKMDLDENTTTRGRIHNVGAGMEFLLFPLSLIFLQDTFSPGILAMLSNVIGTATLILFLVVAVIHKLGPYYDQPLYYGLIQKTDILLITIWMITVSFLLMRYS